MKKNGSLGLAVVIAATLALAACKRDEETAPQTGGVADSGSPAVAEPAAPATSEDANESSVPATDTARPENAGTMATSGTGAIATLQPVGDTTANGRLLLTADANGVRITGSIVGLAPNAEHGFHVHEVGDCGGDGASNAGGHFNPTQQPHGNPVGGTTHHAGDIPNLMSDAQGNASVEVVVPGLTLGDGGANDVMGKAIIVHEKRDDYATQPSGDSGARIACGTISAG